MIKNIMKLKFLLLLLLTTPALAAPTKIQQQGIKTSAECIAAGATNATCLPLTSQIYDIQNNQQLSTSISSGALGGGGGGGSAGVELLSNPGFETGGVTSGWSTTGGAAANVTSGTNLIFGSTTGSWQASASGQFFQSAALAIKGLSEASCQVTLHYLYTGTSGDYTFRVIDGSSNVLNSIALPPNAVAGVPVNLVFPCGSLTTSTLQWRIVSNIASPGIIYMDNAHLGSVGTAQVSQAKFLGSISWPPITSCTWSNNATSNPTTFTAVSNCTTPVGSDLTGSALAPATKVPGITFASLPAGSYYLVATGDIHSQTTSGNSIAAFNFTDGFTSSETQYVGGIESTGILSPAISPNIVGHFTYTTPQSNITFQAQGASVVGVTGQIQATAIPFGISVYYFPSTTQSALSLDQSGWFVDATLAGTLTSNINLGTATVSTFTEMTSPTLFLTKNPGSAPVQIACISGTASSGVNCGVVDESAGIVFNVPVAGTVKACASFSNNSIVSTVGGNVTTAFQLAETTNTNSTTVAAGSEKISNGFNTVSMTHDSIFSSRVCSNFTFSSAGQKTIRLKYIQTVTSPVLLSELRVGSSSNSNISWTVYPITANTPAPLLVGSVTSNSSGLERVERAHVNGGNDATDCTSSPCTIATQSGSWVTSVTRSGVGSYQVNFTAGNFSNSGSCTCSTSTASINATCTSKFMTSSSVTVRSHTGGGSLVDGIFDIICMGPR